MPAYLDFTKRHLPIAKNKRLAHILDCNGANTSELIQPLEHFWSMTTHYPVKVKTSGRAIVARNPAILYLAMLTTDNAEQATIFHLDRNQAQNLIYRSETRRDPEQYGSVIFEWIMRLVTMQHYDAIVPHLEELALSGVDDIAYISDSRNTFVGVEYNETQEVFSGSNIFGIALTNILKDYVRNPTNLLAVVPPIIEDFNLIGLNVQTFTRKLKARDSTVAPRPSEVFKFGKTKSKSELFLEM